MKKIPFIEQVALVTLEGEAVKGEDGRPRHTTQFEFFMGRLSDTAFTDGKEGLDAMSFVVVTRLELENQKDLAAKRGFWLLEDDRAQALQRAALKPKSGAYNPAFAQTILPLARTLESLEKFESERDLKAV